MVKYLNIDEAVDLINKNDDVQLLDIRSPEEIAITGFIKDSVLVDLNDPNTEKLISGLDKQKKYLLYCASGSRVGLVAIYMDKSGFSEVYSLRNAGYSQLAIALKNIN